MKKDEKNPLFHQGCALKIHFNQYFALNQLHSSRKVKNNWKPVKKLSLKLNVEQPTVYINL